MQKVDQLILIEKKLQDLHPHHPRRARLLRTMQRISNRILFTENIGAMNERALRNYRKEMDAKQARKRNGDRHWWK